MMNRYSGGNSMLNVGAFAAPLIPLTLLNAIYDPMRYLASPFDVFLLWLTGLGISYGLIIVHEAGHLAAARIVGIEIENVTIGHWRKLATFRLKKLTITLRAAPASGYVMPIPLQKPVNSGRRVLFLLAGVAAEGVVAFLTSHVPGPQSITSFGDLVLAFARINIVLVGAYHVVVNLLPFEGWVGGVKHPTDGLQLLQLWKQRHEQPAQQQLIADIQVVDAFCKARDFAAALKGAQALASRHPDNFTLLRFVGTLHAENGDTAKAEEIWRDLLKKPLSSLLFAEVLDALCCLPLYHGRMELISEADSWTTEAIRYAPNAITLKGTRGGVLIEMGRIDEGITMLKEVIKRSECPIDQVISSAYLAKAFAAKGDLGESKRWQDKANAINPEHVVIKRINKELSLNPTMTPLAS